MKYLLFSTSTLLLNGLHSSDNPFAHRDPTSTSSSPSSASPSASLKSVAVANGVLMVDQKKKALLMNELFGKVAKDF